MAHRKLRRWLPRSLVGRLILWALTLSLVSLPLFQLLFTSAVSRISQDVVDTRLVEFGLQVRGYWASLEDVAVQTEDGGNLSQPPRFSGGPDADWVWQITRAGQVVDRSDLLILLDRSIKPQVTGAMGEFLVTSRETEVGPMRVAERLVEHGEVAPVHFLVGIRQDRYDAYVADHAERLQTLALLSAIPVSLVLLGTLLFVAVTVRRELSGLSDAMTAYEEGRSERIEGRTISELSALVDGMNKLLRQNRKLIDRTRKYVSKIAHDINHPLAIMKNVLSEKNLNAEDQLMLHHQVDRMTGLVDRYASLARAIGPDGQAAARTQIADLLDDSVSGFGILYRKTPLQLEWRCDAGLVFPFPRHDLETLISNLLSNAHKYAVEKAIVSAGKDDDYYWLCVEDDGPGIAAEVRDQAINWGTRLDESPPGTGFGLSIVRDIAELYDGAVMLDVSPNLKGLRVTINLPRQGS